MPYRTIKDCVWLVLAVAVTRYLFRTKSPYLLDSINFILGVKEFDPARHQPHPPGYYLYIQAARLLQFVWSDPHAALVALSILASCGSVVVVYLLTMQWFDRPAARFAGLLFIASPLCWFHGGVALVYMVEMFFSLLVGLLCWRNAETGGGAAFSSAIALGLAAGVRQSSIVFLGPLWLFSLRRTGAWRITAACGLLAATLLAWLWPMAAASGGAAQYWNAFVAHWKGVPGREMAAAGSVGAALEQIAAHALFVVGVYVAIFAAAAPLPLLRPLPAAFDSSKRIFAGIWIGPGLLFFVLVFMRLVAGGYLLVVIPPVLAVIGAQAAGWFEEARAAPLQRRAVLGCFLMINLAIFLFAPAYFSYRAVRTAARQTLEYQTALRESLPPDRTLIVAFDEHVYGSRHAGYYLPEYLSIELPATATEQGIRIRAMRDMKTTFLSAIPKGQFEKFAFYPPEPSLSQSPNAATARELCPPGVLRTENAGRFDVVTGSAGDLDYMISPGAQPSE